MKLSKGKVLFVFRSLFQNVIDCSWQSFPERYASSSTAAVNTGIKRADNHARTHLIKEK